MLEFLNWISLCSDQAPPPGCFQLSSFKFVSRCDDGHRGKHARATEGNSGGGGGGNRITWIRRLS